MFKISKEARIGIATIIAIVMFIWGFNFLKGKNIFRATNTFYLVYNDLGGLKESGEVLINGFKVGQVTNILLEDNGSRRLIVKILVQKKYKIPVGSTAKLSSIDFMSTKAIELYLSNAAEYHLNGDTLQTFTGEGIMDKVQVLEEKIMHITFSVDTLLTSLTATFNEETRNDFQKTVKNLRTTTDTINEMFGSDGEIKSAVNKLNLIITKLNNSLKDFPETMSNFHAVSDSLKYAEIKLLINTAAQTAAKLNDILEKTSKGEGTIGQLVNNDSLYHQLNETTLQLNLLLKDLQEHPKRYVHFSVFGKKDKR